MRTPWHRRTLRHTAWGMLWVWWLFLAIGVAHACSANSTGLTSGPAVLSHHSRHEAAPSMPTASQNAICLGVCAAGQSLLTKSSTLDSPVVNPLLFVLDFPVLTVATTDQRRFAPPEPIPWRRELPVTLRFPRLII